MGKTEIKGRPPIHKKPNENTKKINEKKEEYAVEDKIEEDKIEEKEMEDVAESLENTTETNFEKEIAKRRSVSPHFENNAKPNEIPNPNTPHQPKQIEIASKKLQPWLIISGIAIILSIVVAFVVAEKGYLSDKQVQISHIEKKTCHLKNLEKMYPLEEKTMWETLKYDIEEITNNKTAEGPSVYLFLQDEYSKARFILTDIAELAASCYDSHSKPIILTREDFDSNDYGITIEKYQNRIHDGGVVVVLVHLNELPGKAARALHTICDKYSPIVKNAIILLTLRIDDDSKGPPIEIAENTLRDLWKPSLKDNELDPLIVRVSDSVFRLKS